MGLLDRLLLNIYARAYQLNPTRTLKQHTKTVRWYFNKLKKSQYKFCYLWAYVHTDFLSYYLKDPFSYTQIDNLHDKYLHDSLQYYGLQVLALQYYQYWVKRWNLKYVDIFKLMVIFPFLKRWIKTYRVKKYSFIEKYLVPDVSRSILMPYLTEEDKPIIVDKLIVSCWQCYIPNCQMSGTDYDSYLNSRSKWFMKKPGVTSIYHTNFIIEYPVNLNKSLKNRGTKFVFPNKKIGEYCEKCGVFSNNTMMRLHIMYDSYKNFYYGYLSCI